MSQEQSNNITVMLKAWSEGDENAADRLMPLVYDGLRRIAAQYLRKERGDHTFQPTALVHEAYLKLIDVSNANWQNRAHFFAAASTMMRHILVDHARARRTDKRGGEFQRIELDEAVSFSDRTGEKNLDVLALDEALTKLAEFDEQQSRIVELRFFGGLTVEETAEVLRVSPATVKREWSLAKAWLYGKING